MSAGTAFWLVVALIAFVIFSFKRANKLAKKQGGLVSAELSNKTQSVDLPLKTKENKKFECPICGYYEETIKFVHIHDSIYNYQFRAEASVIKRKRCSICNEEITIVVFKSGSVRAYDDVWEAEKRLAKQPLLAAQKTYDDAEDDLDEVETEIINLSEDLAENKNDKDIKLQIKEQKALLAELKKKLKASESFLNKEERKFEKVQDNYDNKRYKISSKFNE